MARTSASAAILLLALGSATAAERWESPRTPVLVEPLPGTTGLSAESCGTCHPDIYAEWKASTHAHAWTDAQFQAELHKDPEVGWVCLNCHTPVADQQAELAVSTGQIRAPKRSPNAAFDAGLRDEGITCLACHWRPEGIAAPHADTKAPHPVVHEPELLTEALCVSCHQAVARVEPTLVCTFNTGVEWQEAQPGKTCPECHMPRVTRPVALGGEPREGGRHTWPGSLIPKDAQPPEEAALSSDWEPGIEARLAAPPEVAAVGEELEITAVVENVRAGHLVPSGDPERYLRVRLRAFDRDGALLAASTHRIGQRWTWWPEAHKESDNRLARGEPRELALRFVQPAGGSTTELTVDHVRISPENAAYHDLGDYPTERRVVTLEAAVDTPSP